LGIKRHPKRYFGHFYRGMSSDFGFCPIISIWGLVVRSFIFSSTQILRGHLLRESERVLERRKGLLGKEENQGSKVTTINHHRRKGEPPVIHHPKGSDLHYRQVFDIFNLVSILSMLV